MLSGYLAGFAFIYVVLSLPLVGLLVTGVIRLVNEHVLDPYDPEEEEWRATARRSVLVRAEPDRPRPDDGRVRPGGEG